MGQGKGDIIGGSVLSLLAVTILILSAAFPRSPQMGDPGTAFFPNLIAIVFLLCSVGLFVEGFRQNRASDGAPKKREQAEIVRLRLFFIGIIALYIIVMPFFGFLISTFFFLLVIIKLCNTPGWPIPVTIAIVTSVSIYFAFREILNVPLPEILL
jgi:putative tricarboxylic transport membrane protein